MTTLKLHSHKEKAPDGVVYPVHAEDVLGALEPCTDVEGYLSLTFTPHQSASKDQRDRALASGRYHLLQCRWDSSGEHLTELGKFPWDDDEDPKVVSAHVFGVAKESLLRGAAIRPAVHALLTEAFSLLAPKGLDHSPRWMLDVELDANVHAVVALLKPWNGGEYAVSKKLERFLEPTK